MGVRALPAFYSDREDYIPYLQKFQVFEPIY